MTIGPFDNFAEHMTISQHDFGPETLEIYSHPMSRRVDVTKCRWCGANPALSMRYCGSEIGRVLFTEGQNCITECFVKS